MGTSSSGSGGGGGNPLIPSWIDHGGLPGALLPPVPPDGNNQPPDNQEPSAPPPSQPPPQLPPAGERNIPISPDNIPIQQPVNFYGNGGGGNRYVSPRRQFNQYARSGGANTGALRQALRTYSRTAAGNTTGLARRMQPSAARVALFYDAVDTIRRRGVEQAFREFNLLGYVNRPILDTLSALGDLIFRDTGRIFEHTQDDSITRVAYSNTVMRISEDSPDMDLNQLTNEQVEVMIAVFIEETVAQRVIADIGNQYTKMLTDIASLLAIEEGVYQIVNGMVRTQIMPEIIATQRGDRDNLERNIENIYRTAFDAMAGTNE